MSTITVQDIQRDPLAFLRRVEAGEAFVVVRGERALAEVRPWPQSPSSRAPTACAPASSPFPPTSINLSPRGCR
jgi:antitoxin (DNA-binding transcriptional repressor) of toxin-antitoxin stability system